MKIGPINFINVFIPLLSIPITSTFALGALNLAKCHLEDVDYPLNGPPKQLLQYFKEIDDLSKKKMASDPQYKAWCKRAKDTCQEMLSKEMHLDVGLAADAGKYSAKADYDFISESNDRASIIGDTYQMCFQKKDPPPCGGINGKACTGIKHFPGLGGITVNPHHGLDKTVVDLQTRFSDKFLPFYSGIHSGACTVMVTHLPVKTPDGKTEVCTFSKDCVSILRKNMGFEGLIVTDEILVMDATLVWWAKKKGITNFGNDPSSIIDLYADQLCANENKKAPDVCYDEKFLKKYVSKAKVESFADRNLAALKAGNDLLMNFQTGVISPKELKDALILMGEHAKKDPELMARLQESLARVWKKKQSIFPKLVGLPPPSKLEHQIAQLLMVRASDSFTEKEMGFQFGSYYETGVALKPQFKTGIPPLLATDVEFNRTTKGLKRDLDHN